MANIKNSKEWAEHVRQIEVGDRVIGGTDAPINICLSHLVGRTGYLKDKIEAVPSATTAGMVKTSSAVDSDSEETVATSKAVKTAYDAAKDSAGKGLPVGAIVAFPRAITRQEGFLKLDGNTFNAATYPDLYSALGSNKLPDMTRSDVGMTAYFPFSAIPDGWLKYDEIAAKVTQAAYPELYRLLVAQYGSISNVKPVSDYFVRNVSDNSQIGKQYPWQVGDHHHLISTFAYGNDDMTLKRLPYENYYPNQVKAGEPMIVVFGQLGGSEGRNTVNDVFSQAHADAAVGKYAPQKHAVTITYDHAYTDQFTPKPYYQDNTPKYIGMVLCIKAKNSLDDVVLWIKAYGAVSNAGQLDASTLAADLHNKADKGHTHRAADITDLADTVKRQIAEAFPSKIAKDGYVKQDNGLIRQWGLLQTAWPGEGPRKVVFPIAFPGECFNVQLTVWSGGQQNAVGADITVGAGNLTAESFDVMFNTWGTGTAGQDVKGVFWEAIGH